MTIGNTNAVHGSTDYPHGTVTVTVTDEEASGFAATVTASRADGLAPAVSKQLVLSGTEQSAVFELVPGTWSFATTYPDDASAADTAEQTVTDGGEYAVSLEITYTTVYSIIYDKSLAADPAGCLTYARACAGFTPMSGGNGDADEGSWAEGNGTIFDAISLMVRLADDSGDARVVPKHEDNTYLFQYGVLSYDHFTRIPKIYQKVTQLDDDRVQLDLSTEPFNGATLHPAFVMDGVEYDYKDIGRFFGLEYSSKMYSNPRGDITVYQPETQPTAYKTRAEFRTLAKARGDNYGLLSYYDWDLVNKLFLLAFKTFDSQAALGLGYTMEENTASCKMGSTVTHSWMYGDSSNGTVQVSFLGLEDWWGNLYQNLDNWLSRTPQWFDDLEGYIFVSQKSEPSDDYSDMDVLCTGVETDGWVYPLACRAGLNDFFLYGTSGGSENSGMCDGQTIECPLGSSRYALVGGRWANGARSGAFCIRSDIDMSTSDSTIGARLVRWGSNETSS